MAEMENCNGSRSQQHTPLSMSVSTELRGGSEKGGAGRARSVDSFVSDTMSDLSLLTDSDSLREVKKKALADMRSQSGSAFLTESVIELMENQQRSKY